MALVAGGVRSPPRSLVPPEPPSPFWDRGLKSVVIGPLAPKTSQRLLAGQPLSALCIEWRYSPGVGVVGAGNPPPHRGGATPGRGIGGRFHRRAPPPGDGAGAS